MAGRRLTAILAADVAGYSALMGENDVETVAALKGHQSVVLPMISGYSGRVIDTAGDGILAEFGSVYNAVKCAMAIQEVMSERNASVPPDKRMQFRIGINQGDVLFDEDRIYGDGINIAARLEGICRPGGICISGKVYEEIRGRFEVFYEDIGEQALKNISDPVRTYRISIAGTASSIDQKRTIQKYLIASGIGLTVLVTAVTGWWFIDSSRLNEPRSTPAQAEISPAKSVAPSPQTSPRTTEVAAAVEPGKEAAKQESLQEVPNSPAVKSAPQKETAATVSPGAAKQSYLDETAVRALANRLGIPLPTNIKIVPPEPTMPAIIAEYLGVWGGEARWGGTGRQILLGLMSVDTKGVASGFYAAGPPNSNTYGQSPAYFLFFGGSVDDEGLKFEASEGRFKYHFRVMPGGHMLGNFRAPPANKSKNSVNSTIHLERIGR